MIPVRPEREGRKLVLGTKVVGLSLAVVGLGSLALLNVSSNIGLRAPWTGATLVTIAVALIGLGYISNALWGVGLAVLACEVAAVVGLLPLEPEPPGFDPRYDCDPGCVSPELFGAMVGLIALLLAGLGLVARRGRERWRSRAVS